MKRVLFLLFLAALLLTGCHVDHDPWPTSGGLPTAVPAAATLAPDASVPAVTAQPVQQMTQSPVLTPEPTEVPGGSTEPGING